MSPSDPKNSDPLADLDDDLGDDWESAFQAEDFMFSPEEEANDFFLFDENDSDDEADELTSIMEEAQQQIAEEQIHQEQQRIAETTHDQSHLSKMSTLASMLLSKLNAALSFLKKRPVYQRALIAGIPSLLLILLIGSLFLKSTSDKLAQTDLPATQEAVVVAEVEVGPQQPIKPMVKATPAPTEELSPTAQAKTIRKQWDFPTFTIVTSSDEDESIFVNVNLSLIAILPEGSSLPEHKRVFVKDAIYQFYKNRPPNELKHFALARGEMIHKLHNWLQKQWPDSPINTVIFSKYQVIRTPRAS